jgi:predicted lipid carrier protein YhbT
MSNVTAEFFDGLAERGHIPDLEKAAGTVRFDVVRGKRTDHWLVTIRKGDVAVAREEGDADCVATAKKQVVDGLVTGKENALATFLRGDIVVEGDIELLVLFQRLFPSPTRAS